MTATRTRPAAGTSAAPPTWSAPTQASHPPAAEPPTAKTQVTGGGPLIWAELALATLTLSAVLGLARLVDDGGFLPPVLICTVGAHALAALARRKRWPTWLLAIAGPTGLIVVLGLTHASETTLYGLPTGDTLEVFRQQLADAGRAFAEAEPPAPLEPGYVVAWAAAAWIVALVADAAAFRARAAFESIVPAASLFVFASALGSDRYRVQATTMFFTAALLAWLSQRLLGRAESAQWVGVDSGRGLRAIAGPGASIALFAVAVAALLGPHLPGANAEPAIPWNDRGVGPSPKVAVSPLVDLRTQLVQQSDAEVFTVVSQVRTYWRLTALDEFDGQVWSSNNRYSEATARLPFTNDAPAANAVRSIQTFRIAALTSSWLPAAYRPVAYNGEGARYNAESGTLLLDDLTEEGQSYTVVSLVPRVTEAGLSSVPPTTRRVLSDPDTALPANFSPRVTQLSREIVAGASSTYQQALRLQDYLRSSRFTYDLGVGPGQSERALERFLFETRRGYCEQFAGAFAAMARSVGIPARVAVGFTPGEQLAQDTYRVLGLNAHAWPEVFIDGYGWVPFEPTPGRGIPSAEGYTGVPEQQATAAGNATTTTVPDDTATTTAPESLDDLEGDLGVSGGAGGGGDQRWIDQAKPYFVGLAVLPFVWFGLLSLTRRELRQRRRHRALGAGERVLVAWREATSSLARAGLPRHPWETPDEFASRVGISGRIAPEAITELAKATTEAVYAGRPLADRVGERASELADTIDAAVVATLSRRRRWKLRLDPRTLRLDQQRLAT